MCNLPEHLSSLPVFSGVSVSRSLVLCVCLQIVFCPFVFFSYSHCIVCSSIYRFWLSIWYLQALLSTNVSHYFVPHPLIALKICHGIFHTSNGFPSISGCSHEGPVRWNTYYFDFVLKKKQIENLMIELNCEDKNTKQVLFCNSFKGVPYTKGR